MQPSSSTSAPDNVGRVSSLVKRETACSIALFIALAPRKNPLATQSDLHDKRVRCGGCRLDLFDASRLAMEEGYGCVSQGVNAQNSTPSDAIAHDVVQVSWRSN